MNASSLNFKPNSGRVLLKKERNHIIIAYLKGFSLQLHSYRAYSQEKNVTSKAVHVVFSHSKSDTFSSG